MFACRRARRWIYYRLEEHVTAGRAVQVRRGYWRPSRAPRRRAVIVNANACQPRVRYLVPQFTTRP